MNCNRDVAGRVLRDQYGMPLGIGRTVYSNIGPATVAYQDSLPYYNHRLRWHWCHTPKQVVVPWKPLDEGLR